MRDRVREKLALWGGTAILAAAILGTIAARPFRRAARRAHSARTGHGRPEDAAARPPPAAPPDPQR